MKNIIIIGIALLCLTTGYLIGVSQDNQKCTINPPQIQHKIELRSDCPVIECKCEANEKADLAYCLSFIKQAKKFEKDLKEIR